MIIREVAFHRYLVPYRVPFTTSHGLEQHREGILIRLRTSNGLTGFGEATELTSFGTAPISKIEAKLRELGASITGASVETALAALPDSVHDARLSPARFALETALLDAQARRNDLPLSRFLDENAAASVPLNATIGDMDLEEAATAASNAVATGYTAVKLKVGMLASPEQEARRVAAVREAIGPETELRLDANAAWSIDQTVQIANALEPYDIAYIEQPLPADDIAGMAELRSRIALPIAADEAATSHVKIKQLISMRAVDVIIIKPAICGGITAAQNIIGLATEAGVQVVITTALETGIGISAALHLAATVPEPVPACGLATGSLLETDLLLASPEIVDGRMRVPKSPGIGVEPVSVLWAVG